MFGLGLQEMMVIAVLAIVFIPPDDLPKVMRTLGRYYAKIRRASDDLRRAFNAEVARVEADDRREEMERRRKATGRAPEPELVEPDPRLPADAAPRRAPTAPPPKPPDPPEPKEGA